MMIVTKIFSFTLSFRLFEYILLYKDGVMFQIEQATKQCSKITLADSWDPLDIPQNATFEDQYSIGGPQEQITVQEWSDRQSARSCKGSEKYGQVASQRASRGKCLSPLGKVVVRDI